MKYVRNESIYNKGNAYDKNNDNRTNRIWVGNRGYSSTHSAIDETTGKVHSEVTTESTPLSSEFYDLNDTAKTYSYRENDQLPLFHAYHEPAQTRVGTAFSTERGRTHTMVLLAIAKARGEQFVGPTTINPGDDLSQHSLRLAEGAKKRGLISPDVELPDSPTNNIDFFPSEGIDPFASYYGDPATSTKVPVEDIKAGKNELRKVLRGTPQPKKQPPVNQSQFEQLRLDGF